MEPDPATEEGFPAVAAVDLGSNSFHLLVARVGPRGELIVMDKMKERVRLAAGLDDNNYLTAAAQERAIACLRQFGQRVGHLPRDRVRVVGTNTLRRARNGPEFVREVRKVLGHRVDIVSGREEARLIYLGVAHDFHDPRRRLLIDIGGGSTELAIGERFEARVLDSLYMGCVSYSMRFFADGKVDKDRFKKATYAARIEFQAIERSYRRLGWDHAVGSSGTVLACERILRENGLSNVMTLKALKRLRKELITAGKMDKVQMAGLKRDRKQVLPGGLAILIGAFQSLEIDQMTAAQGAMREGILYDLIGRLSERDIREDAIQRFSERFQLDDAHARRVEDTALELFDQIRADWGLNDFHRRLLGWSARLHELGHFVSYSGYHKHGAYILRNADLAGFSWEEQQMLSGLVLLHRGKLTSDRLEEVGPVLKPSVLRVAVLLRLAVRLHRSRVPDGVPELVLSVDGDAVHLEFPDGWLSEHSLTEADLSEEASTLKQAGFRLEVTRG